jgi:hypothetical protein
VVNLPREISPGAGARRSLLVDCLAALAISLLVFQLAAGVGVVGVLALPVTVALLLWIAIEAAIHQRVRRRESPSSARARGHRSR